MYWFATVGQCSTPGGHYAMLLSLWSCPVADRGRRGEVEIGNPCAPRWSVSPPQSDVNAHH